MSWYDTENNGSLDVAVSTRIRLARNISKIPFPSRLSDKGFNEINERVKAAVENSNLPISKELKFIKMEDIPENERYCMAERHIISPEFAKNYKNRAILISGDETICIMLGEEDHIRIQVILPGICLEKAYKIADLADDMLCSILPVAYDKRLGFLTECPTNLGTGMRASVMLHLPLLKETGELKNFADSASKIGYTVRGMYGEGSKSDVPLFQISNQTTLGLDEKNAIGNLNAIAEKLIARENELKSKIDKLKLKDISMRAYGTLKYARILSSEEMMKQISRVCLGMPDMKFSPLKLFIEGQPHSIMKKYGQMSADDRDIKRAEMVREAIEKEEEQ